MSKAIAGGFKDDSNDDLRKRLAELGQAAARALLTYLIEGANIVKELEARGIDTREFHEVPFILRLREIAQARTLPEVAVNHDLYKEIHTQPLSIQRKILDGETFPVINIDSVDVTDIRHLTFENLTDREKEAAIGRSPEQQAIWIRNKRQSESLKKSLPTNKWEYDKKTKTFFYDTIRLTRQQMLQMLASNPE